ncbi:hypothetical protein OH784_10375 [Ectobacillus funiculus]|uniref:hypothetical protein n=1 Tax=Ectobacillus funiculus TaxID=137993 RepID=UPI0039789648
MEYKTPMIAEKMGVSTKVVMRIVQQLNLEIKKNKFGHYVFNEEDVQTIMANYSSSQETAATVSPPRENKVSSSTIEEPHSVKTQRDSPSTIEEPHSVKTQGDSSGTIEEPHSVKTQGDSSSTIEEPHSIKTQGNSSAPDSFHVLQKQVDDIEYRLLQNEDRLRQKADGVVQYQLLQHRNDIEELQKKVESLEAALQQLERRKQPLAVVPDYSATKPKRRSIIFSIFGL